MMHPIYVWIEKEMQKTYTNKQPLPQTYFSDRLKILNPKVILDAYLVHSLKYILVMDRVPKKFDKSHFSANSGFKKLNSSMYVLWCSLLLFEKLF